MRTRSKRYSVTPQIPFLSPAYPSCKEGNDTFTKDIMSDSTFSVESFENLSTLSLQWDSDVDDNTYPREIRRYMDFEHDLYDPFIYISTLPPAETLPPIENILPPQTRSTYPITLILDLDETMVHCSLAKQINTDVEFSVQYDNDTFNVYASFRPYLKDFLNYVSKKFELICFTASRRLYADPVLDNIDPERRIFRHRLYREHCRHIDEGYVKDLSILGRDLSRTIIVDNCLEAFGLQVNNGIPINSWYSNEKDNSLMKLIPFLERLYESEDVREVIYSHFKTSDRLLGGCHLNFL